MLKEIQQIIHLEPRKHVKMEHATKSIVESMLLLSLLFALGLLS